MRLFRFSGTIEAGFNLREYQAVILKQSSGLICLQKPAWETMITETHLTLQQIKEDQKLDHPALEFLPLEIQACFIGKDNIGADDLNEWFCVSHDHPAFLVAEDEQGNLCGDPDAQRKSARKLASAITVVVMAIIWYVYQRYLR